MKEVADFLVGLEFFFIYFLISAVYGYHNASEILITGKKTKIDPEVAKFNFRVFSIIFLTLLILKTIVEPILQNAIARLNLRDRLALRTRTAELNQRRRNNPEHRNKIKITKPGTIDQFISLFRVGNNYYSTEPITKPVEKKLPDTDCEKGQNKKDIEKQEIEDKEDKLCQICFASDSNILFMPCHHSGLCRGCCIVFMKKEKKCLFCRKVVQKAAVVKHLKNENFEVLEYIEEVQG